MGILCKTQSVCPECLRVLPAEVFEREAQVWIRKTCNEHGKFEDLYWSSYEMYRRAEKFAYEGRGVWNPNVEKENPLCPADCGLCRLHESHTALANLVVTNRCDLNCWYCFFQAQQAGYIYEPALDQIREMIKTLRDQKPVPCNAVQLTGGEPLLRDDLLDIIRICKEEGIEYIQLNTNGVRLAQDSELVKEMGQAGVNTIYLSFDGLTPKTNQKNHWEIPQIMENCREANIGICLVPTVIKSINDHEIGDILRFGLENINVVRGVNFQPVSLVGRMSGKDKERYRITIPGVIENIEEQTGGEICREDFYPVPAIKPISNLVEAFTKKPEYDLSAHFSCGMGTYVFEDNGKMLPITGFIDVEGLLEYLKEKANEIRTGKSKYWASLKMLWKIRSFVDKNKQPEGFGTAKLLYNVLIRHNYEALENFHLKTLFIGMMHFMDLANYDVERVKKCCIHYVMTDNRVIPFCAFNVIPEWYRDKDQKSQGISFEEWEKTTGGNLRADIYQRDKGKFESSPIYKKVYNKYGIGR
ncbi:tetraether lipid synthase Tes [Chloroflexota bacterium]